MNNIFLTATNCTPEINFSTSGNLLIKGRSLPEDTAKFYDPLQEWIKDFDMDTVCITICLDYMNSSSSQQISKFLQTVRENPMITSCMVKWYYEEGDEDNLDFGKEIMQLTDLPFQFFETAEFINN
jgi:hypothetical protein